MNSPTLLPIGAFSNATQLSPKALRLYADHNILTPARIDAETGYRYYRPEQVHQARLVRWLRELDVPLASIAAWLANPAVIETQLKRHMNALSQRYTQQQTAFHATLAQLRPAMKPSLMDIVQRALPAMHVVSVLFEADSKTLAPRAHNLLTQLGTEFHHARLESGSAFIHLSAPFSENEEITLELCVPDTRPREELPGNYSTRHWPAQSVACVSVPIYDDTADFISASDALFDWFDRNGASLKHAPLVFPHGQMLELAWPIS